MKIEEWNERYAARSRAGEDFGTEPTPLVQQTAAALPAGMALDLACGAGRNALWLAAHGWNVRAIDGADAAIHELREQARVRGLTVDTAIADLEAPTFHVQENGWDLILDCYYLQRSLFPRIRAGVRPGGVAIAIVHITNPGEEPNYKRAAPGELRTFFSGWEILHDYEGAPRDSAHRCAVAEIVARKPE